MLPLALTVHSLLRWAVILLGAWAVSRAKRGWFFGRPWTEGDDRAGRLFVIGVDVQVLLGLLLYLVLSPITTGAFQNMSDAMQDSGVRFWVVEHLAAMLRPADVAEAVHYVATRPVRVTISEMVVFPTSQIAGTYVV